jgi:hypothetical protein
MVANVEDAMPSWHFFRFCFRAAISTTSFTFPLISSPRGRDKSDLNALTGKVASTEKLVSILVNGLNVVGIQSWLGVNFGMLMQ